MGPTLGSTNLHRIVNNRPFVHVAIAPSTQPKETNSTSKPFRALKALPGASKMASNRQKLVEKWRKHCRVFFRVKTVAHNFRIQYLDDRRDSVSNLYDEVVCKDVDTKDYRSKVSEERLLIRKDLLRESLVVCCSLTRQNITYT